jgi:hypothetical protein
MFGDYAKPVIFEIAYTDNAGRPNMARHFSSEDIEKAADFIAEKNETPGTNIYLKPAPVTPMDANNKRTGAAAFEQTNKLWADIDRETKDGELKRLYHDHPPSFVVITGHTPFTRAQLYWQLYAPELNEEAVKHVLRGIEQTLRGDPAVVDVGTLMRVGGTIAWPYKQGRVAELTEAFEPEVSSKPMDIDYFETTFPAGSKDGGNDKSGLTKLTDGKPRSPITGRLKIDALLQKTREPGAWHTNMRDAIAAMVSAGWNNEQIKIACGPYCEEGAHDPDIAPLIDSARSKWNIAEPEIVPPSVIKKDKDHEKQIAAVKEAFELTAWNTAEKYQGKPAEISWLVENIFPQGVPVLFAAQGGLGKSFLALQLAMEIARPPKQSKVRFDEDETRRFCGGKIKAHGKAVFLTAEDNYDSIHRRIDALDPIGDRVNFGQNLLVVPMPELGGPSPIISGGHGGLELTPFFEVLKEQLLAVDNLRLVIIDPMQAFVAADITASPETGQFVWSALSNIAAETGATVIVTHHMRKDGMNKIKKRPWSMVPGLRLRFGRLRRRRRGSLRPSLVRNMRTTASYKGRCVNQTTLQISALQPFGVTIMVFSPIAVI